jgi:hypothetical protein
MKLPRSLKLPRKLKKELKKGFRQNIHPFFPNINKVGILSGNYSISCHQNITYSGSNTKSFFRLCRYARKEQVRMMKIRMDFEIESNKILFAQLNTPTYDKRDFIREQEAKLDLQFIQEHGFVYKPDAHMVLWKHGILETGCSIHNGPWE